MDELDISGKRYISSRRAAKENHYHTDYIGQLIRAKKIIGTKVGRAWYVEEESLKSYLHAEAPKQQVMHAVPVSASFGTQQYAPLPIRHIPVEEVEEQQAHTAYVHAQPAATIRYAAHDEPLVQPKQQIREEEIPHVRTQHPYPAQPLISKNEVARSRAHAGASRKTFFMAAIAAAGIVAFLITAYASIFGSAKVVVQQGKTQAAVISF